MIQRTFGIYQRMQYAKTKTFIFNFQKQQRKDCLWRLKT